MHLPILISVRPVRYLLIACLFLSQIPCSAQEEDPDLTHVWVPTPPPAPDCSLTLISPVQICPAWDHLTPEERLDYLITHSIRQAPPSIQRQRILKVKRAIDKAPPGFGQQDRQARMHHKLNKLLKDLHTNKERDDSIEDIPSDLGSQNDKDLRQFLALIADTRPDEANNCDIFNPFQLNDSHSWYAPVTS